MGWDALGCGKEKEREGGKANTVPCCKYHDEHWTMSDRPGLDSQMNHFPAV